MNKKTLKTKKLFEKLNREMPKLAKLAMLDCQQIIEDNEKSQRDTERIIRNKIYY